MHKAWLLLALASWLCALPSRAEPAASRASPPRAAESDAPPGYDETVRLALREFELENYAEARTGFLKAHALYPNARTLRALGLVSYELKSYVAAVDYLTAALSAAVRPLTSAQRTEVEGVLQRARGYVGRYHVSLRPAAARLSVDGEQVDLARDRRLALSVGNHALDAQAEGYLPLRRNLEVIGGAEQELDLVLQAREIDSATENSRQTTPRSEAAPVYKKWWLWTTVVAVVAGGVAAGLVLSLREPKPSEPTGGTTDAVLRLPLQN